jgi:hypothetical protein
MKRCRDGHDCVVMGPVRSILPRGHLHYHLALLRSGYNLRQLINRINALAGEAVSDTIRHPLKLCTAHPENGPPGVESQVRDDLSCLLLSQPVVHRPVKMVSDLRDLTRSNQRADDYQTPISRREIRT